MAAAAIGGHNGQEKQAHASCGENRRGHGSRRSQSPSDRQGRRARQKRARRHFQASRRPQTPIAENDQAPQARPRLSREECPTCAVRPGQAGVNATRASSILDRAYPRRAGRPSCAAVRSPKGEPESPDKLERELELAVAGRGAANRATDGVEIAGIYKRIGHGEDRVIQEVKCLETELQFEALGDGGGLHGAEVEAHVPWSAQDTAAGIAEDFLRSGKRNSGGVPPVQQLLGACVRVSGDVAIVLLESYEVDRIIAGVEAR